MQSVLSRLICLLAEEQAPPGNPPAIAPSNSKLGWIPLLSSFTNTEKTPSRPKPQPLNPLEPRQPLLCPASRTQGDLQVHYQTSQTGEHQGAQPNHVASWSNTGRLHTYSWRTVHLFVFLYFPSRFFSSLVSSSTSYLKVWPGRAGIPTWVPHESGPFFPCLIHAPPLSVAVAGNGNL
ncbi:hypothetical protein BS50DRAFT_333717 [Corynespora cassiicola Philippines]|uniref:Uncharacterized protein n=1 Tax=Corynespora cassiicola Philippines TaxID=1448308 RepID=A0A2T2NUW0_CORCC|nr:hypothetical protein BS50DRAFT_333717 [Corynespora cassiicola Philippines]